MRRLVKRNKAVYCNFVQDNAILPVLYVWKLFFLLSDIFYWTVCCEKPISGSEQTTRADVKKFLTIKTVGIESEKAKYI